MSDKNQDQPKARVQIGYISGAHGIKGLVKVRIDPDFDESAFAAPIYSDENAMEPFPLTLKNRNGKHYLASIEGVTDRNASEDMRETKLYIDEEHVPDDVKNRLSIVGFKVFDEQGEVLGEVIATPNFGASDLIEIKPVSGGDAYYIPFAQQFVLNLDEDNKTITVTPIEMI